MTTAYRSIFQALIEPFEKEEVKTRPQSGKNVPYVTARTVMNRLDNVLGPENWWDDYIPSKDSVVCILSIRLPDRTVLTKMDAGGYPDMKAEDDENKGGFSDAFKRAAVKFGIARYLYGDGVPRLVGLPEAGRVSGQPRKGPEVSAPNGNDRSEPSPTKTQTGPQKPTSGGAGSQHKGLGDDIQPAEPETFWTYLHNEMQRCNSAFDADYADRTVERNPETGMIVDHTEVIPYLFKQAGNRALHPFGPNEDTPMNSMINALYSIWNDDPRAREWMKGHIKKFLRIRYLAKECEVNGGPSQRGPR